MNTKSFTGLIALTFALVLTASTALLAGDANEKQIAKQTRAEECKDYGGTWTAKGKGGTCVVTKENTAKKKKTLKQWCKDHGGTWTSDGYQGGSCAL